MALRTFTLLCNCLHHPSSQTGTLSPLNTNSPFPSPKFCHSSHPSTFYLYGFEYTGYLIQSRIYAFNSDLPFAQHSAGLYRGDYIKYEIWFLPLRSLCVKTRLASKKQYVCAWYRLQGQEKFRWDPCKLVQEGFIRALRMRFGGAERKILDEQ